MSSGPQVLRARFPQDYGARGGEDDDPLPWTEVEERIAQAPNYWIATVRASGAPHARPVDGVWVDGALCFGGSPDTRWVRNLQANPAISVHLPSGDDVVILEGEAQFVTDPQHPFAAPSQVASQGKYPQYYGEGELPFHPFWMMCPQVAYAWSLQGFPKRATRWTFGD